MINNIMQSLDDNIVGEYDKPKVERYILKSIKDGRFSFINQNGLRIGFFTWEFKEEKALISNLVIFKGYRGFFNILRLRKMIPGAKMFLWRSRKRQRDILRRNTCLN
jgi:hypothetical protein